MTSQNPTTDGTWTSQNGHCEHCLTGCPYTVGGDRECSQIRHISAYRDTWPDGGCDICALITEAVAAERERIVAALHGYAEALHPVGKSWKLGNPPAFAALQLDAAADRIERGAHLEEK